VIQHIIRRTNNATENNSVTAQIPTTLQKYFHNGLSEKITNRQNPGTTYCAYTECESVSDQSIFTNSRKTSCIGEDCHWIFPLKSDKIQF